MTGAQMKTFLHFIPLIFRHLIKNTYKRPSMFDTISYMLLMSNRSNIEVLIEKSRCQMRDQKLTLQPFIIIKGPSYSEISDTIIIVFDNIKYLFNSLVKALETA